MDDQNPVVPQDENTMGAEAPVKNSDEMNKEEVLAAEADKLEEGEETPAEESAM